MIAEAVYRVRVGKVSESKAAVTTPHNTAPIARSMTPTMDAANEPELAIRNDGYTTTINSAHAVITVTRRPTRSEYSPANGQIAAANSNAISDTSNAVARLRPPATCR
ncbi:hypothetical protein D3C81_1614060 [compost metagenome]